MNTVQILIINSSQGGPVNKTCQIGQLVSRQLITQQLVLQDKIRFTQFFVKRALYKDKRIQLLNQATCRFTQHCTERQQTFLIISGDHSCAMGSWAGVLNALHPQQRLGLLWLDAHLDAHTYVSSPSGNCHGMPIAALLGLADPKLKRFYPSARHLRSGHLILLGARSYEAAELRLLNHASVEVIHAHQIDNFKQSFLSAYRRLAQSCTHIGISLDLDLVDPTDAPAVATPVADGITAIELLEALRSIQGDNQWCGLECAEFIPHADYKNRTLKLLLEIMQIYSAHSATLSKPNRFLGLASSGIIRHSVPS